MRWIGRVAALVAGVAALPGLRKPHSWNRSVTLTADEVVREIDKFLAGSGGPHDWDDFLAFRIADPDLDEVRERCARCDWQTEIGRDQLLAEANRLRNLVG